MICWNQMIFVLSCVWTYMQTSNCRKVFCEDESTPELYFNILGPTKTKSSQHSLLLASPSTRGLSRSRSSMTRRWIIPVPTFRNITKQRKIVSIIHLSTVYFRNTPNRGHRTPSYSLGSLRDFVTSNDGFALSHPTCRKLLWPPPQSPQRLIWICHNIWNENYEVQYKWVKMERGLIVVSHEVICH